MQSHAFGIFVLCGPSRQNQERMEVLSRLGANVREYGEEFY